MFITYHMLKKNYYHMLKKSQATKLKYKKALIKLHSNSSRQIWRFLFSNLNKTCNLIGPTKLLQSIWLDNSNPRSAWHDIISLSEMISYHFTGIIFTHGFITLISTHLYVIKFMNIFEVRFYIRTREVILALQGWKIQTISTGFKRTSNIHISWAWFFNFILW